MRKFWILLLCGCLFAGCAGQTQTPADTEPTTTTDTTDDAASTTDSGFNDEVFEEFLDQYVIDVCENDYTTAHHYFEDPSKYGIDVSKAKITLGTFIADDEEKEFTSSILSQLHSWDPSVLNKTNQEIFSQLEWMYSLEDESNAARFDYVTPIWSEMKGVQSNLTDFFSEYQLYTEDDIAPLIELINDVPRYVEDALDYSKEQAERGMLRLDLDTVKATCQSIIDSKDDSPITAELDDEVDALMLEDKTAEKYKEQIRSAMEKSFFPSYEKIITGLEALKDDIGDIQGMAAYDNGKDYYEILLKYYTGTNQGASEINTNIYKALNDASSEYRKIVKSNPDAADQADNPTTSFMSVTDIMSFLEENYSREFPVVSDMNYEVKALSDEQSKNGVVAYFVVPPIDSTRTYEIRYNARDYGDDASALSLYETLAHEGIPGHMYQTQYERDNFTSVAQFFISAFGMQEGYATYAAYQAEQWTDVNKDVLRVAQLSDLYLNYTVLIMDMQINYDGYSLEDFNEVWGDGMESLYYQLAENPGVFFGYYYGYYMIDQLYQKASDELGDKFDASKFNNALLEAGNVEFSIVEKNINSYIESAK